MTDAILGTIATLAALDGEVEVEIKPGTQSADIVTVKDRGITRLRGGGRGELKIGIQVVTPVRLNSKESQLIKQFAESRRPGAAGVLDLPAGSLREAARSFPRGLRRPPMASLYLIPEIDAQDAVAGGVVRVTGDEARHAISVARLRVGERISVGDGAGLIVEGVVTSTDAGELVGRRRACAPRGATQPRALARAGAREGRPRRARGAGGDRARCERRDPVGSGALGVAVGGCEGREGPGALGSDRAGGEQAVDPGVGSRGDGARDDDAARRAGRRRPRARADGIHRPHRGRARRARPMSPSSSGRRAASRRASWPPSRTPARQRCASVPRCCARAPQDPPRSPC